MTIKQKIIGTSTLGMLITGLFITGFIWYKKQTVDKKISKDMDTLAKQQCASTASSVYKLLQTQHENALELVSHNLNVAHDIINQKGQVSFSNESVTWDAINQYTKKTHKITLPKMLIGNEWLGQNRNPDTPSPIVDKVQSLVGGTCTIFQRMNEAGDMLRVCTNIKKSNGTRAIGTYIPATNLDGTPNPVISTILKGKPFNGMAYIVDDWYITAYEPIFNEQKKVTGMLYTRVRQLYTKSLRKKIMGFTVGKTGYVYILAGSGPKKGEYIISKDGARDGENILNAKDDNGNFFIQSMIKKAMATKNGECIFQYYPWKNKDEKKAREKMAAVTYFAPWNCIIGAGTYTDNFQDATKSTATALNQLLTGSTIGTACTIVICFFIALFITNTITKPLNQSIAVLKDIAEGEGDLTKRLEYSRNDEIGEMAKWVNTFLDKLKVIIENIASYTYTLNKTSAELSATSTQLAGGAEEMSSQSTTVAAAAEEMSANMNNMASATEQMSSNVKTVASAIEEMNASISEIAKNAEQASSVADKASTLAQTSNENISHLGTAADEIGRVIEVIQDIAEQTNLLALNATIEAARAGDAGKGFAVVATEVKELAKQTAEATEDIAKRITAIQSSTTSSVQAIGEITQVIREVNEVSRTIASAVEEQSITTKEIAHNVAQTANASETVSSGVNQSASATQEITQNITGVDTAAKQTAQGASQMQNIGSKLTQVSEQLRSVVDQFKIEEDPSIVQPLDTEVTA